MLVVEEDKQVVQQLEQELLVVEVVLLHQQVNQVLMDLVEAAALVGTMVLDLVLLVVVVLLSLNIPD
jgi:hypothetical protein